MVELKGNKNYAATVVTLGQLYPLPGLDRLRGTRIYGNQVLVGADTFAGSRGLFFPLESALSKTFLGENNLYRKAEFGNKDALAKGYFDEHGRVRAIKFKGHRSEGLWLPLTSLLPFASAKDVAALEVGTEFDHVGDVEVCRKYVPRRNPGRAYHAQTRTRHLQDGIKPHQFHFHIDTENLRRNAHKVLPTDYISVTDKWHGTSVIVGNLLVEKKLGFASKVLRWLGLPIESYEYGLVWSSRKVVKGVGGEEKATAQHYYDTDVWGVVAKEVQAVGLPAGYTVYAEIVGFTPSGSAIQGQYAYGCAPGTHRTIVYRVTVTTVDGTVAELSWRQLVDFCRERGLEYPVLYYYGKASGLTDYNPDEVCWSEHFLDDVEKLWIRDQDCDHNPGLPAEGIVLRVDSLRDFPAYKLKNFRFLERETSLLDKGEVDLEEQQSAETGESAAASEGV